MVDRIKNAMTSDVGVATTRTTVPLVWLSVLYLVLKWFGVEPDPDALAQYSPILAAGYGVLYRILREVERKWPAVGRIIFGSTEEPYYI